MRLRPPPAAAHALRPACPPPLAAPAGGGAASSAASAFGAPSAFGVAASPSNPFGEWRPGWVHGCTWAPRLWWAAAVRWEDGLLHSRLVSGSAHTRVVSLPQALIAACLHWLQARLPSRRRPAGLGLGLLLRRPHTPLAAGVGAAAGLGWASVPLLSRAAAAGVGLGALAAGRPRSQRHRAALGVVGSASLPALGLRSLAARRLRRAAAARPTCGRPASRRLAVQSERVQAGQHIWQGSTPREQMGPRFVHTTTCSYITDLA
jgi:hypothetical protein